MLINTKRSLTKAINKAQSFDEWKGAAANYDKRNGLDRWRRLDETSQYDYVSIRRRLDTLRSLKARRDIRGLLFNLNEGIHGNLGGMGSSGLYGHAKSGTKHLIENYIDEVVNTLEMLAEDESGDITFEEKVDFFRRASHCFGRSAFMMSGSGSLLYFHIGVAKALTEADLLPTIISGSSGGSLVGSVIATHTAAELIDIFKPEYFASRLPTNTGQDAMSRIETLEYGLEQFIPDMTFQEAFEKTGRAINISVAPVETHQTSRLLNATTSPAVLIRSAVKASCAVPGIFPPVTLQTKDIHGHPMAYLPSRQWVDGSVSDDLPAKRLARLYGVNHYVVSQTNPHVLPFVSDGLRKKSTLGLLTNATTRSAREWINALSSIADKVDTKGHAISRATNMLRSIINQDYVGDINILPDYKVSNPFGLLSQPTEERMLKLINTGERCTWPKLEMIRRQTMISRKLDELLAQFDS
ncbi:MAG: NTE family protein [Porticoccus sp.]|jgi:NTE family protein